MSKNQLLWYIQDHKKTQFRIRLELGLPHTDCAEAAPINQVGTKLSSNLQSPDVRRTHSYIEESRFMRDL